MTFIRWGKSSCPETDGTELIYAGKAGGTFYNVQGGGTEKLCLPDNPDYLSGTSGTRANSLSDSPRVFGAEYQFFLEVPQQILILQITMYPALSAMLPQELQLSWFLLKLSVHLPGPVNTMDI